MRDRREWMQIPNEEYFKQVKIMRSNFDPNIWWIEIVTEKRSDGEIKQSVAH